MSLQGLHHTGEHRADNFSCLSHLHHWIPLFKLIQFNLICVFPVVCIFLSLRTTVHLCQLLTSVTHELSMLPQPLSKSQILTSFTLLSDVPGKYCSCFTAEDTDIKKFTDLFKLKEKSRLAS